MRIKKLPLWKKNLYAVWITQFLSIMGFAFCVPVLPYYIQELGITDPDTIKLYTGLISFLPAITLGIMAPIWGAIADRFGKKPMLARALFFAMLILLGLGFVQNANQILIIRFVQGLLTGTVAASYSLVAAGTPDDRMSFALGLLASSIFIGNSTGLALGGLVADLVGYRSSFFIGSLMMLGGFIFVLIAVKEIKSKKIDSIKSTKIKGIRNRMNGLRQFIPVAAAILPMIFMIRVTRTLSDPYIPIYIQEIRNTMEGSASISGIIRAVASIATALAGIFIVRLGDRYNKYKLSAILLCIGAVASIPLFITDNIVIFTALNFMVFLAIGGVDPIMSSQASIMVTSEKRGVLFGLITMVGSFGWAVSPLLGSYISIKYSTQSIFVAFSVLMLLGAVLSLVIDASLVRRMAKKEIEI
ncbi:MAG: MFS transporter [Clostridia bacterium]|nr:MFS transporter [Clostridia bacterium]